MKIKKLLEERANLVTEARSILDTAQAENRSLTDDENVRFDALMADANEKRSQVERLEALEEAESTLDETRGRRTPADTGEENPDPHVADTGEQRSDVHPTATAEYRTMFMDYMASDHVRHEHRTVLQVASDAAGGYLVPEQLYRGILKDLENQVLMRQLGTTIEVKTASSFGIPYETVGYADAVWTAEVAQIALDEALTFGKRELAPTQLAKRVKVSMKLLRQVTGMEGYIRGRLSDKFASAEENAFMTGDGSGKPLGIFTASASGIPTSRDIRVAAVAAFTADELINLKYSLPAQYARNASMIIHRTHITSLAKLKDSDGQYLWQQSLQKGTPDMVLGHALRTSEYAPSTAAADEYVAVFGDFSYYWIVDALTMSIQKLTELYAETSQIGLIGRKETDGAPVMPAAFSRLQFAAS